MLDEQTFVMEFRAYFLVYRLMLETARPVAILTGRALEESGKLHDYNAWRCTLDSNVESVVV